MPTLTDSNNSFVMILGAGLLLGLGCQGVDGNDPPEGPATTTTTNLGEVAMADGSRLIFRQPYPDLLAVNAVGGRGSAAISLFQHHEGSIPALYELAAKTAPPSALIQAQSRVDRQRAVMRGELEGAQAGTPAGIGATSVAGDPSAPLYFSANDFQTNHCPSDHDFLYCFTDQTWSWSQTRKGQHVHACVEAVSGDDRQLLEYDSGLFHGWRDAVVGIVPQGSIDCWRLEVGNQANYRYTIDQAVGHTFHVSFYGNL